MAVISLPTNPPALYEYLAPKDNSLIQISPNGELSIDWDMVHKIAKDNSSPMSDLVVVARALMLAHGEPVPTSTPIQLNDNCGNYFTLFMNGGTATMLDCWTATPYHFENVPAGPIEPFPSEGHLGGSIPNTVINPDNNSIMLPNNSSDDSTINNGESTTRLNDKQKN